MKCCACSQRVAKGRIAANESDKREDRRYHSVKSRAMFRHSLPIGFLILRTPLHFKKLSTRDIGIPLKIRTRHRQFDGGWPEGGGGCSGRSCLWPADQTPGVICRTPLGGHMSVWWARRLGGSGGAGTCRSSSPLRRGGSSRRNAGGGTPWPGGAVWGAKGITFRSDCV